MATNLLTPKATEPNGVPPKNILAFIALGLLIAIGLGAIYLGDQSTSTVQEKTKNTTLQEATSSKELGVKGDPKDVSTAADKAGVPASLRADLPQAGSSSPRVSGVPGSQGVGQVLPAPGVQPGPYPLPLGVGTAAAVSAQPSQANIDAVRDTEISNAKAIVVDFGGTGLSESSAQKPADPIERLIQSQRSDATQRSADLLKVSDAARVAGGGVTQPYAATPISSRDADKSFIKEFATTQRDKGIRPSLPEASIMLAQGSSIEAVVLREINSDLPGVITARTTRDIYDSTSVAKMVIPAGSTVIGEYSSDVRTGQSRILFAFTRLILPNGQSFDLNGFGGSDAQGRAGMQAEVNNHYFRLFGTSLLIGVLADQTVRREVVPQGGAFGGGGGMTATGQILTDTARSVLERSREVRPTLTVKAGTRVLIEVRRDMIFPSAYRG